MALSIRRLFAVVALLGLARFAPSPASAEQLVKFDSAGGKPIQGYLTKPKGDGPFPTIVLLHSCLGPPANRGALAAMFANWGYVTLLVDDFATRGVKETCATEFTQGPADAFGALNTLARLPFVDPKRVAAIGYSQGGDTALRIAAGAGAPRDIGFKVAVAFYPPCANQGNAQLALPTLILVGEADDVTPAADCERLAKNQARLGDDFRLVVYPRARHLFDDPAVTGGKRLLGMWLQYDAAAAEQSKRAVREFLEEKLGR